jgi:Flp pilus assembly protein CpaB
VVAELVSPRATRLAAPRWLDARLALGVLLVLASVVAGARLLAAADDRAAVLVARHDLVPGQHLTADDFTIGHAQLSDQAGRYVAAAAPPIGYVVTRFVGTDELLPADAVAAGALAADSRYVTVPVQPGHLPGDLGRGDLVDVYLTRTVANGAAVPAPTLVLSGVPVRTAGGGSRVFGSSSALSVELEVPKDRVSDLVHAVESGTIDLVAVPAAATSGARP